MEEVFVFELLADHRAASLLLHEECAVAEQTKFVFVETQTKTISVHDTVSPDSTWG